MTTMSVSRWMFLLVLAHRVVPDKLHRAVKRLCVCVCVYSSDDESAHSPLLRRLCFSLVTGKAKSPRRLLRAMQHWRQSPPGVTGWLWHPSVRHPGPSTAGWQLERSVGLAVDRWWNRSPMERCSIMRLQVSHANYHIISYIHRCICSTPIQSRT